MTLYGGYGAPGSTLLVQNVSLNGAKPSAPASIDDCPIDHWSYNPDTRVCDTKLRPPPRVLRAVLVLPDPAAASVRSRRSRGFASRLEFLSIA